MPEEARVSLLPESVKTLMTQGARVLGWSRAPAEVAMFLMPTTHRQALNYALRRLEFYSRADVVLKVKEPCF